MQTMITAHLLNIYYVTGHCAEFITCIGSFNTALLQGNCHYPHLTDDETEAQRC